MRALPIFSLITLLVICFAKASSIVKTNQLEDSWSVFQTFDPEIAGQNALEEYTNSSAGAVHEGENSIQIKNLKIDRQRDLIASTPLRHSHNTLNETTYLSYASEWNANVLMDLVLQFIRNIIKENNMDRVPMPGFEETFYKKVGIVKVKGTFKGESGWLESTSSITRKGDSKVRLENNAVILEATLGLQKLNIEMKYTARFSFIRVKGHLRSDVHSNAVAFAGGLDFSSGKCRLFLQSFKLSDLGKIEIHVTGLGKLNWIWSKSVSRITSRLHNKIQDTVESQMRAMINKSLEKFKCPSPFSEHIEI